MEAGHRRRAERRPRHRPAVPVGPGRQRADRSGTYSLNGYTLELRYDSGKVERHLFFGTSDRKFVFFRGSNMMRDRK